MELRDLLDALEQVLSAQDTQLELCSLGWAS